MLCFLFWKRKLKSFQTALGPPSKKEVAVVVDRDASGSITMFGQGKMLHDSLIILGSPIKELRS